MDKNKTPKPREQQPHRPIGFSPAKTSARNKVEAEKPVSKESKIRKLLNSLFHRKKPKKKPRPKPRRTGKPKKKGAGTNKKQSIIIVVVVTIIVLILAVAIAALNSNRQVHQMPTILRITEEPTQEPE